MPQPHGGLDAEARLVELPDGRRERLVEVRATKRFSAMDVLDKTGRGQTVCQPGRRLLLPPAIASGYIENGLAERMPPRPTAAEAAGATAADQQQRAEVVPLQQRPKAS